MNIVILTNDNYFSFKVLEPLLEIRKKEIKLVIFSDSKIGKKSTNKSVIWLYKYSGFRHTFFKLLVYFFSVTMYYFCMLLPFINNKYSSYLWVRREKIPFLISKNINEKVIIEKIKSTDPDIIISVSMNQIVGEEILNASTFRPINVHCAPLPRYRGMSPYVWALANNEKKSAATIHYMEKGLDEGDIVEQIFVPVEQGDSAFALFNRCCIEASKILPETVNKIISKKLEAKKQDESKISYYSWPDKKSIKSLKSNGFYLFKVSDFWKAISK